MKASGYMALASLGLFLIVANSRAQPTLPIPELGMKPDATRPPGLMILPLLGTIWLTAPPAPLETPLVLPTAFSSLPSRKICLWSPSLFH